MNTTVKALVRASFVTLCIGAQTGHADPVGPLTSFTAGTLAKASEVNGNFTSVKTAVDDNAARIAALESSVASLQTTLTTAQNQIAALQTLLAGVTRQTVNGHPT